VLAQSRPRDSEYTLVKAMGDLDLASADELDGTLRAAVTPAQPTRQLIVELSDATFLDCCAVGVLVATRDPDPDRAAVLALLSGARALRGGRNIALLFERASTGIRASFEVAAHDQGTQVTYPGPDRPRLGTRESVQDSARALGRAFDGITFHGRAHTAAEQLADEAQVPVWNGRSNLWQPVQVLADLLTMSPAPPPRSRR
jgi:anti-anti-sigma factor